MTDHEVAARLATAAGKLLLDVRTELAGASADERKAAGDKRSHDFLMDALAIERPGDGVLSEEGADNPARLTARRVWIVDPLDGTREFGEPGRSDWAVHVALWESDTSDLTAGAVALPAQDTVLSTLEPPPGPPGDEAPARIRIVVSRSRPPGFVRNISGLINAELVPLGSAGAKVAAVICGEVDAYVHGGGFYEWDTAAPVAVARAAGLHASRIDGSALAYNQPDLLMPDILVCRPAVAGILLRAIREVTHAS